MISLSDCGSGTVWLRRILARFGAGGFVVILRFALGAKMSQMFVIDDELVLFVVVVVVIVVVVGEQTELVVACRMGGDGGL